MENRAGRQLVWLWDNPKVRRASGKQSIDGVRDWTSGGDGPAGSQEGRPPAASHSGRAPARSPTSELDDGSDAPAVKRLRGKCSAGAVRARPGANVDDTGGVLYLRQRDALIDTVGEYMHEIIGSKGLQRVVAT
eukprot:5916990-Pyramimonas_sp.AAC.1